MRILGTDLSHWNGDVNFEKLKEQNVAFSIAKAGEVLMSDKREWDDPRFRRNITEAREHGIITGAYYFFHPAIGASQQARHFIRQMDAHGYPDLPPVIDVETTDGLQPAICAEVLYSMIQYLERELGRKPIIYTRNGFWVNSYGGGKAPSYSKDYKFWLAQYPLIDPIREPFKFTAKMAGTSEGVNPIIWQFTEKMRLPGLPNLDGNWWLGTQEELEDMIDNEIPDIPDEPEPPDDSVTIEITANFLRLRKEPTFYAPPTLIVEKGQRLEVISENIHSEGIEWYEVMIPEEYGNGAGFVSANGRYSRRV